ncbi:MAG: WYL domain-containing protein [Nitriliruptorales bacterium]|nr:WYL domain-containing protein [Nitriliruptorales bacterium]
MPGVEALTPARIREALLALGQAEDADTGRATRVRRLQESLRSYGTVRTLLERAPHAAREAFLRLIEDGPAPVEHILGRGWWGRGMLPPPLDWLQARGLVVVTEDGLLHPLDEARQGFLELTLDVGGVGSAAADADTVDVQGAAAVVVTSSGRMLDRVLTVAPAQLRAVAPTVAVSTLPADVVTAALRSAGIALETDAAVEVSERQPALPSTPEQAAGPRAIRVLLQRAVQESRQVRLEYYTSSRAGAKTDRVVDPWSFDDDLLRGYCHLREGERSFAVDRIGRARLLTKPVEHAESSDA